MCRRHVEEWAAVTLQLPISYKHELKYVTVVKALFDKVEILIDSLFT